jgi:hypothetical protein
MKTWMRDSERWGPVDGDDGPHGDGLRNLLSAAGVVAFLIVFYNLLTP